MFWKKKNLVEKPVEKPVEPPKPKKNVLTVYFSDKSSLSWSDNAWKEGEDLKKPWEHLYTWYTSETGDLYTFTHSSGFQIFRRKDIRKIIVEIR